MEMTPIPDSPEPFPLRIEDYLMLDRAGAFQGQRTELIEGVIVAVNAEYRQHFHTKGELMFRFKLALRELGPEYDAYVEPTLALPPRNMPEPDVLIARIPRHENDFARLEHVAIVIEVGASTLRSDLGTKRRMYAQQNIPEYWVVDVNARRAYIFWSPMNGAFQQQRVLPLAGELRSATMPELAISGDGIL